MRPFSWLLLGTVLALTGTLGCHSDRAYLKRMPTPAEAGLNTNDLLDVPAQQEADTLANPKAIFAAAEKLGAIAAKQRPPQPPGTPRKSILCLSGGGSFGSFSAGVMCGWTCRGDRPGCNGRPNFDVVTGISTGALVAPLVFLGPQYDEEVRKFFTTVEDRDIYRLQPVRGLFKPSLATNAPLAKLVDSVLTEQIVQELAAEYNKGRRLYIGSTELESGRFIIWDIGAIANRNCDDNRELIKKVLLGSSAIPGFFPPSEIVITVDGKQYKELHGDGGTSMAIFFRPPWRPESERANPEDLSNADLYMVVAGKLYSDAQPLKPRALSIGTHSVSNVIYAQTRGDLQRMFMICTLTGMSYNLTAIPPEFPSPKSSSDFSKKSMTAMFNEGYRLATQTELWRKTPPTVEPGESLQQRDGTNLTEQSRGPASGVVWDKRDEPIRFPLMTPGIPVLPATITGQPAIVK